MSERKTESGPERYIPLSTAAVSPVYGALGSTLYNPPRLDGGTLLSFDTLINLERKLENKEYKDSKFYPFFKNELRYAMMAADLIKNDPVVRAYFPPTFSGLQELSAVLHMRESQRNTDKLLDEALSKGPEAPFVDRGPAGGVVQNRTQS